MTCVRRRCRGGRAVGAGGGGTGTASPTRLVTLDECRAQKVSCGAAHTAFQGWPVLRNGAVCRGAPTGGEYTAAAWRERAPNEFDSLIASWRA